MPGPTIAHAEVLVDLDGRRIPAEARALGSEAGDAMGDAHNDAYGRRLDEGFGDFRDRITREMRNNGDLSGRSFSDSFRDQIQANRSRMMSQLSSIFANPRGLDEFRRSMGDLGHGVEGVDVAANSLNHQLEEMLREGQLVSSEYDDLRETIETWRTSTRGAAEDAERLENEQRRLNDTLNDLSARQAADEMRILADEQERVRQGTRDLADSLRSDLLDRLQETQNELNRVHEEALGVNDAFDSDRIDRYMRSFGQGEDRTTRLRDALGRLLDVQRENVDEFTNGSRSADTVGRSFERNTGRIRALSRELGLSNDAISEIISGGRTLGSFFDDLGDSIEESGHSSERASRSHGRLTTALKGLLRATSQFDPTDNLGQMILLIAAFAAPLAGLLQAAAGQLLILGTVAGAALVGVAGLAIAFKGMFGDISKLPSAVQPAAAALQGLSGPLDRLRDLLQTKVFAGLADEFTRLGRVGLPGIAPGVAAVGSALNGFLGNLTNALTNSRKAISDMLVGFAPIISSLGSGLISLGGILGGIFKAATPFAQVFAKNLATTLSTFSDFLNSARGQNALADFFRLAQDTMSHVTPLLGAIGAGIAGLITPATTSLLHELLDTLTASIPAVTSLLLALAPLGNIIGDAFNFVLSSLAPLYPALGNLLDAIRVMGEGLYTFLRPGVEYLSGVLGPIIDVVAQSVRNLGTFFTLLGSYTKEALAGAQPALTAFGSVLHDIIIPAMAQAGSSASTLKPVFEGLGAVVGAVATGFVDIARQILGAIPGFDRLASSISKGGSVMKSGMADAAKDIGAKLQGLATFISGTVVPVIVSRLIPAVVKISSAFIQIMPTIAAVAVALGAMAVAAVSAAKTMINAMVGAAKSVGQALKGIQQIAQGDVVGGMKTLGGAVRTAGSTLLGFARDSGETASKTGSAVGRIRDATRSAMSTLPGAVSKVSSAFDTLTGSVKRVPDSKHVKLAQSGAEGATSAAQRLGGAINALHDKTVTIKTVNVSTEIHNRIDNYKKNGAGGTLAASGGIMDAGGRLYRAKQMAGGGILRNPTYLAGGNILAGEAGPEAIVPLTGALAKIDPSVRGLAAAARGLAQATHTGNVFEKGAIIVETSAADARIVASQVMDRLIPLGG